MTKMAASYGVEEGDWRIDFGLEVRHATATDISVVRATDTAMADIKGVGKYNL